MPVRRKNPPQRKNRPLLQKKRKRNREPGNFLRRYLEGRNEKLEIKNQKLEIKKIRREYPDLMPMAGISLYKIILLLK